MSEKKIVVPEGMLVSALAHYQNVSRAAWSDDMYKVVRGTLEASLRWLSENPIVPTDEQWRTLNEERQWPDNSNRRRRSVIEWQRRMFLAPEPEIPEAIKDLLEWDCDWGSNYLKDYILEAFRRGQKAGPQ